MRIYFNDKFAWIVSNRTDFYGTALKYWHLWNKYRPCKERPYTRTASIATLWPISRPGLSGSFSCQTSFNLLRKESNLHYTTIRKVADSIPDEVIRFFNWLKPSSRTIALGSTQPLTEMSTRNLPESSGWQARKADNLTAVSRFLRKSVSLKVTQPYGPPRPLNEIVSLLVFFLSPYEHFVCSVCFHNCRSLRLHSSHSESAVCIYPF
jgi:hypothetical protein